MAEGDDVVFVQLATRIPKDLHRDLRLHCVDRGISLMSFVTAAITEKLANPSGGTRKASARRGSDFR